MGVGRGPSPSRPIRLPGDERGRCVRGSAWALQSSGPGWARSLAADPMRLPSSRNGVRPACLDCQTAGGSAAGGRAAGSGSGGATRRPDARPRAKTATGRGVAPRGVGGNNRGSEGAIGGGRPGLPGAENRLPETRESPRPRPGGRGGRQPDRAGLYLARAPGIACQVEVPTKPAPSRRAGSRPSTSFRRRCAARGRGPELPLCACALRGIAAAIVVPGARPAPARSS